MNTSTSNDIRLLIVSTFYEAIQEAKISFVVHIKHTRVVLVGHSTSVSFTDNIDSLKPFLLDQVINSFFCFFFFLQYFFLFSSVAFNK